jgi:hypothetical protein
VFGAAKKKNKGKKRGGGGNKKLNSKLNGLICYFLFFVSYQSPCSNFRIQSEGIAHLGATTPL